jgi:hypothetical protein
MLHHKKLDWPQVPQEIEEECINYATVARTQWIEAKSDNNIGYSQFDAPNSLKTWVKENIPLPHHYTVILQQYHKVTGGNKHIDKIRTETHNYLLLPNNAISAWYNPSGQLIERVQYKIREWYWHDSSTTHQVTNIDSTRLAISVYESII